jgi:hypothetical protein
MLETHATDAAGGVKESSVVIKHADKTPKCVYCADNDCYIHSKVGRKNPVKKNLPPLTAPGPARGRKKEGTPTRGVENLPYDSQYSCFIEMAVSTSLVRGTPRRFTDVRVFTLHTRTEVLDPRALLEENGRNSKRLVAVGAMPKGTVILEESPMLVLEIFEDRNIEDIILAHIMFILKGDNRRFIVPIKDALDSLFPRDFDVATKIFLTGPQIDVAEKEGEYLQDTDVLRCDLRECNAL